MVRMQAASSRSTIRLLEGVQDDFGMMLIEMNAGVRDQWHHDAFEERAQDFARRIRAAFRGTR